MMRPVAAYDPIAMALAATPRAVVEADVLAEQWALGEDASLRDDPRFRRTPAGRWVLAMHYLANDWLVTALRDQGTAELSLKAELITAAKVLGAQVAWCEADAGHTCPFCDFGIVHMLVQARDDHLTCDGRAEPHAVFFRLAEGGDRGAPADDHLGLGRVALHQAGDALARRQNSILLTYLIIIYI